MRLKSFYARTMSEAMRMVKETLGEDAIIVATREEAGGKSVRVTAAVEQNGGSGFRLPVDDDDDDGDDPQYNGENFAEEFGDEFDQELMADEENENAITEALTDIMLKHRIPSDLTDHILSCAGIIALPDARASLVAAIEHLFDFRPLPKSSSGKAIMMVGPPGAGKTLAIAKMAARGVMNDLSVAAITTDISRAGGYEQLYAFTKILDVDLQRAKSADDLKKKLQASKNADIILIDTAGVNPFSTEDVKELAQLKSAGAIDTIMAMPAGLDPEEASDMARIFSTLGTKWLMPTRLDIARRFGGVLAAANITGMSVADGSHTSQVAEGFIDMSPETLVSYLMPSKTKTSQKSSSGKKSANNGGRLANASRQPLKKQAQ